MGPKTSSSDHADISPSSVNHILLAFLFIGLLLRVGVALQLPRIAHPDEIFQSQEPAHRLAYGYGVISWEWRDGVRSWVFPAFLAGVMRATSWMGAGSSGYLLGIKLVLSLLSLTTVAFSFAVAKRENGIDAAIIAAGTCALWYSLVDFGPRALIEVVSAHVLLPGLYLGVYAEKLDERKRLFAAGLLCGLAVCLRIQMAPAVAFAIAYFCHPAWKRRIPPVALGLLVPLVGFGFADAVTWSYPFESFVRYFWINLVQGRSAIYGSDPWYWYLGVALPLALGPIFILAFFGLRRSAFLSWLALILVASHSVIPHKEARFLYVLWPIAITLAAMGMVDLAAAVNARRKSPLSSRAVVLACLSLPVIFLAGAAIGYHYLGDVSGSMSVFDRLSRDSTVCGVGMAKLWWVDPGGYTHLHRNVPIVFLPKEVMFRADVAFVEPKIYEADESEMNQTAASFNALVSAGTLAHPPVGFVLQGCWNKACLYQRPGICAPAGDDEINTLLKRAGM